MPLWSKSNSDNGLIDNKNCALDAERLELGEIDPLDDGSNILCSIIDSESASCKLWHCRKERLLISSMIVVILSLAVSLTSVGVVLTNRQKKEESNINNVQSWDEVKGGAVQSSPSSLGGEENEDDENIKIPKKEILPPPSNLNDLCQEFSSLSISQTDENDLAECIMACGEAECCWYATDNENSCKLESESTCQQYRVCDVIYGDPNQVMSSAIIEEEDDLTNTATGAATNDKKTNQSKDARVVPPAPFNLPTLCGMNPSESSFSGCIEMCGMASCCWMVDRDDYCFHENVEICSGYNPCRSGVISTTGSNHKEEREDISNIDAINNSNSSVLNIRDDDTP